MRKNFTRAALDFANELPTRASALSKARRAGAISQSATFATRKHGAIARKMGASVRTNGEYRVVVQKKASFGGNAGAALREANASAMDKTTQLTAASGKRSNRQGVQRSCALSWAAAGDHLLPNSPSQLRRAVPRDHLSTPAKLKPNPGVHCREFATLVCRFGGVAGWPSFVDKAGAGPYLRMGPAGPAAAGAPPRGLRPIPRFETVPVEGGLRPRCGAVAALVRPLD